MIVEAVQEARQATNASFRGLCEWGRLPYSSVRRWKGRMDKGEEPVRKPGPKKVEPLDFAALEAEIGVMRHGRKRTCGMGELYEAHSDAISRRDLNAFVAEERQRKNRARRESLLHVTWRVPRLVWAMDDTRLRLDEPPFLAYLHNVCDLGSRHKFDPLVLWSPPKGQDVVENLERLFKAYGPPLFLKRDNGPNLKCVAVDDLLQANFVIPIDSPCYYPRYNGGIERVQGELKHALRTVQNAALLPLMAKLEARCMNAAPKPCLGLRTPLGVFQGGKPFAAQFTKRRRKEIYDEIVRQTLNLVKRKEYSETAAWRKAVETWLLENQFITISQNGRVLPCSSDSLARN